MNIINASSTQNPMGSIMQLATKQTDDTSQGMLGHGNNTTGSVHENFMSKNTSADSPFGSRTEKIINSFLQNPVLKGEENETNEVAGRLRSENNLLHMRTKKIERWSTQNQRTKKKKKKHKNFFLHIFTPRGTLDLGRGTRETPATPSISSGQKFDPGGRTGQLNPPLGGLFYCSG
nr:uncharacterized protein LOC125420993 [Ziziphus jujuba var. spinosa]